MLFDIVIPTYNNLSELKDCLYSLDKQTIKDFFVWVCVDGSTDETIIFLQNSSYTFPFHVLEHDDKKNHGRSATRNLALQQLSNNYVVFLDSDLQCDTHFLENHLNILNEKNTISIGQVQYSDQENVWTNYILSRGKFKLKNSSVVPFTFFETNNVAMETTLFKSLNGFDEKIKTYGGEDTELANRIYNQENIVFFYNNQSIAYGTLNKTLDAGLKQRELFAKENLPYIIEKNKNSSNIFKSAFLQKRSARFLYELSTPFEYFLLKYVSKKKSANIFVHLLVFIHTYRGFHKL